MPSVQSKQSGGFHLIRKPAALCVVHDRRLFCYGAMGVRVVENPAFLRLYEHVQLIVGTEGCSRHALLASVVPEQTKIMAAVIEQLVKCGLLTYDRTNPKQIQPRFGVKSPEGAARLLLSARFPCSEHIVIALRPASSSCESGHQDLLISVAEHKRSGYPDAYVTIFSADAENRTCILEGSLRDVQRRPDLLYALGLLTEHNFPQVPLAQISAVLDHQRIEGVCVERHYLRQQFSLILRAHLSVPATLMHGTADMSGWARLELFSQSPSNLIAFARDNSLFCDRGAAEDVFNIEPRTFRSSHRQIQYLQHVLAWTAKPVIIEAQRFSNGLYVLTCGNYRTFSVLLGKALRDMLIRLVAQLSGDTALYCDDLSYAGFLRDRKSLRTRLPATASLRTVVIGGTRVYHLNRGAADGAAT